MAQPTITNSRFASGMVLAELAKIAPEFAKLWTSQMQSVVAMSAASLESAVSAADSMLYSGLAQGALSLGTAAVGAVTAGSGFVALGGMSSAANEATSTAAEAAKASGALNGGAKLTVMDEAEEDGAVAELPEVQEQGLHIEAQDIARAKADPKYNDGVNPEQLEKDKAAKLEEANGKMNRECQRLNTQHQAISQAGQGLTGLIGVAAHPIDSYQQGQSTLHNATSGIQSNASQAAEKTRDASVDAYSQLLQGAGGVNAFLVAMTRS